MRLSQLLAALPPGLAGGAAVGVPPRPDPEISSIVYDGRQAGPGSLFVARRHRGYALDPHDFAGQAFAGGAVAAVVQRPVDAPPGVPVIVVPDPAPALGWLAAALYGFPATRLGLVGVTGTDGKTTTSALTTAVLEGAGWSTGMISTVASKAAGPARANPAHTSTPEAVEVQALLAETVAGGGQRAVVETTSHALDQERLAGAEFDVAVFTRVTHEHLDYHGTYAAYLAAKAKLLDLLRPDAAHPKREAWPKCAVLNADDASYAPLAARAALAAVPQLRFGLTRREADVRATEVQRTAWGSTCRVETPWGAGRLALPLPGEFNVYNALAAIAAGCTLGATLDGALAALEGHRGVAGRMERVDAGQPFAVVVDFAHTPDALTQVLLTLRPQTAGRLIAVFGSAGERDRAKRPWMGRIAAELADFFVLTDEDPRLEPREAILDELAAGARQAGAVEGERFLRVPDRAGAVLAALERAAPGDTVLLAGKGHERSIIGAVDGRPYTFPWDERAAALAALRRLGYGG